MDKAAEMSAFVRVVQEGSLSAAARAMQLSPSAISKLVSRLEDRLGARLLHRTTRRLSLTEEGEAYFQRSLRILAEIDEAEQAVSQLHAVPAGTLRVNAAVAFTTYQVVPLLPEFMQRYPLLRLHLTLSDRIVDLVEEGEDLGIRLGARFESTLVSRLLAEDHRVICASPAYLARYGTPMTPQDLARHNCLAWSGPQAALNEWPFTGADGPYSIRVKGNVAVNSGETLYEMALAGLGIVRVAEFRVGADLASGRLVPLLADHHRLVPLPIHVVYPHRKHLSPKVRTFVDFLVEKFTPVPPWRRPAVQSVSAAEQ